MKAFMRFLSVLFFLHAAMVYAGTSGKIAGTITDARTGEKLLAANVVVEGLGTGTSTNLDGYFVILNVPPGNYRVRASLVGYSPVTQVNVRVEIDQTTTADFKLTQEAVEGQEIVIVAQRPVVQKDVSASRANIDISDVQKLPVTTVAGAVGLQAGVEGLLARGGRLDETSFILDGQTMRDERTNTPYAAISLLSIQEMQVQTGGFNAEYGGVRSGVVNVVTKEGSASNYTFGFIARYAPTQFKHFGPSIYDRNSYWIRPYMEEPVAWLGTQAINPATGQPYWDEWTQKQYPSFEGWNSIAAKNIKNGDPKQGMSPEALQRLFLWERRKQAEVTKPDYDIDMGFGGPIPFGQALGNLRFFASYRQSKSMYLIPLSEDSYRDYNGQLKITSDLTGGMKLIISGLIGKNFGTNNNNGGRPGVFVTPNDIGSVLNRVSYIDTRIFATDYWAPTSTNYYSLGVKISHALSATTFYEAGISMFRSEYNTNPGALRDTRKIYKFGDNYYVDESPFGFDPLPSPASGLADIRFGVGFSNSRDTSRVTTYTGRFDITNQWDRYNQFKGGVELEYTNSDVHYGLYDAFLKDQTFSTSWNRYPLKGAVYVQDKLEFEGMIANLGIRLDYLNPGGEWYIYNPFDLAFSGTAAPGFDTLLVKEQTKKQVLLSPRLGIAFPISEDAKLFFNYGHFRQQPQNPENLFLLLRSSFDQAITRVADPNAPLPWTVAYELGYEHSLFDEYLLRVAAYYKDIKNETRLVSFTNRNSTVDYSVYSSNAYRDIRGVEVTLSKIRGNWVQGFINYTYDVRTAGYFGLAQYFQAAVDQRNYERRNIYQEKPIPQPYARLNLDFFTPPDFGPKTLGIMPLADWRVNVVGRWSNGYYFTWSGGAGVPGVENNVQWMDSYNFDLRVSKNFQFDRLNLQLFMDVTNVLNTRYMSTYGFVTSADYNDYMQSLHLPDFPPDVNAQIGYINVPGDDRPGMYRKDGVSFQPIVAVGRYSDLASPQNQKARPFYFVREQGKYYQYAGGGWQPVDPGRLQQVLDDKAYIDMPNMDTFTFLNPRHFYYGIRFSYEF